MFYDNFLSMCENAGVSPSRALTDLKIGKGALKRWREGGEPTNPIAKKLADYFGVTVKELKEGIEKAPTVSDERESRIRDAVKQLTSEEIREVENYISYLKSKRK
jgi:transcriptional regulator with XRE-family HTH domain